MASSVVWFWWVGGGVPALGGAVFLLWALFADRSRRRRRCPGERFRPCWYDMSATSGMMCPECGRTARRDREFHRTRRRWGRAALGAAVMIAGLGVALTPWFRTGAWHRYTPFTVIILAMRVSPEEWMLDEMERRTHEQFGAVAWKRQNLWLWQERMFARHCGIAAASDSTRTTKGLAIRLALERGVDPAAALPGLGAALNDPDSQIRWFVGWALKGARFELWSERDECLAMLQAHRADTLDVKFGNSADLAIPALIEMGPCPADWNSNFVPPSPDEFVAAVEGRLVRDLAIQYRKLRVHSTVLTWPWDGESGPMETQRRDVNVDNDSGIDAVVRVSGRGGGVHNDVLVWLRRGDGWRFAGSMTIANQPYAPVFSAIEFSPGEGCLVIDASSGCSEPHDEYDLRGDTWVSFASGRPKGLLDLWTHGHHQRGNLKPRIDHAWTLTRGEPRLRRQGTRTIVEFDLSAKLVARWPQEWPAPDGLDLTALPTIARKTGVARLVRNGSGAFLYDEADSTWPKSYVETVLLQDLNAVIATHETELTELARSADPTAIAWLKQAMDHCTDRAAAQRIMHGAPIPEQPRGE